MLEELVSILAIGVAAVGLFVPRTGSARDSKRTMTRESSGSRRRCSLALRGERTRERR